MLDDNWLSFVRYNYLVEHDTSVSITAFGKPNHVGTYVLHKVYKLFNCSSTLCVRPVVHKYLESYQVTRVLSIHTYTWYYMMRSNKACETTLGQMHILS